MFKGKVNNATPSNNFRVSPAHNPETHTDTFVTGIKFNVRLMINMFPSCLNALIIMIGWVTASNYATTNTLTRIRII